MTESDCYNEAIKIPDAIQEMLVDRAVMQCNAYR